MSERSRRIAVGGLMTALAVAAMLLGGVIPAATFCCPAIAGLTLIPVVAEITPGIEALAGDPGSSLGTGGMVTKLRAARIAGDAGVLEVRGNRVWLIDGTHNGTEPVPNEPCEPIFDAFLALCADPTRRRDPLYAGIDAFEATRVSLEARDDADAHPNT